MTDPQYSDKILELAERYNYAPFMIKQIMINFPDEHLAVINAFSRQPRETIRINTLKITPEKLKILLEKKGFRVKPTQFDYAFQVDSSQSRIGLGNTHEYLQGFYYMQSLASMVPVHLLYPEPGDNILDMCAAPGSKTTQIGQFLKQEGLIIAIDNKESRIAALSSNVKRMGINNCVIFPYDSSQIAKFLKPMFIPDKILLDAPCTGSGIIRVDPHIKKAKNDLNIKRMVQIQKSLLKSAIEMLKPGGLLMYSTCSFHYQENEELIAEILKKYRNIEIIEPNADFGHPGFNNIENKSFGMELLKTRRIYPNRDDMDAFFYSLLKKKY
ncbi:RsmB/NOP family class I SAM-dependent RNA methyltransferase [Promethearchaeum syntrophicum]|uniref:RsmB/NOP family class I SAM-dependent RNA methyltransferase n=1 Tax=Promethearchaeum syntrophicum TaxID=2594042 RepID=A0A5B9DA50_9ARCH|nr:RsmB/NOP family class I SAM-dependent RNA methyltransferase [Candidatus Prometheoarchaeum syntrophicum]QEE15446.1 tRNA (cytosine(48)-C(5))-methyltransferase [Candidatus Prometheoarchaeum syntrophicum]